MRNDDRPTRQVVPEPQPGDGVEISAARARQGYDGRSSRGILWVLVISFVVACLALGVYWLAWAPRLDTADRSGEPGAHGRLVTDPNTVAKFHAPEPAPKQPPPDQVQ